MQTYQNPGAIPDTFEELGELLRLKNHAIKYLGKKFSSPRDAINAIRTVAINPPIARNLNDSMLDLYENASKRGFVFHEYFFGRSLRELAAKLEPYTYLSIELPYSRILNREEIDEEAYCSLRPIASSQIQFVLTLINMITQDEKRGELAARYFGLLPNNHLMKAYGKTNIEIDTRAGKYAKEVFQALTAQNYATMIVYGAFSANEGRYMQRQLLDFGIPDDHSRECLERIADKTETLEHPILTRIHVDALLDEQLISTSARNYLIYAGFNYADQIANLDFDEFYAIKNLGIDDRKSIIRAIKSLGIIFIDERFYCCE